MTVKYRKEIVALGTTVTQAEIEQYRQELSVEDFKKLVDAGDLEDWVIVDMRNDYEYKLGHFKHAIPAGTVNFREVPDLLQKYKDTFANKKILRYCTGGIRCEKLSAMVHKAGMEDDATGYSPGPLRWVLEPLLSPTEHTMTISSTPPC